MIYDLIAMGRVSLDLFSEQLGSPFEEIQSFATSVGGSPSNVAIGSRRLGLRSALLTAVGHDKVGDFVRHYLQQEKVATDFVLKRGGRTGMAVVGVQPPTTFPLTFYRENPADIQVRIEDVLALPFEQTRALLISGTGLARGSRRDASFAAAERAKAAGTQVLIDLDLRPDQWHDPRAYGVNVRAFLPLVDVVIATEEESYAALVSNQNTASSTVIQTLQPAEREELEQQLIALQRQDSFPSLWVLKRGAQGVSLFSPTADPINVAGFHVEIVNTVGAGDAFASGLIYSLLAGKSLVESARFANACGALVVSRQGCAAALPYLEEVEALLKAHERE